MASTKRLHYTDKFRARIKASLLRNKLQDHALGLAEMTPTQIRAAEILLKKCVPDLSAVEHTGEVVNRHVTEMSRDELLAIAAGGRTGDSATGSSDSESAAVH